MKIKEKIKKSYEKARDYCKENPEVVLTGITVGCTMYLIGYAKAYKTAVRSVNKTYEIMSKAGYNVVKLIKVD